MTRRSVRKFSTKPVNEKDVETVLKAGMQAPSANNNQPWHFIVLRSRQILDEIPKVHPYAAMVAEAPVAILVCGVPTEARTPAYVAVDCSAATENMLLAAHALGLGAVWVGIYPREERDAAFRKLIPIPDEIIPFALIPLGYPQEPPVQADRYRPERVHQEQW
jgi:nitroreductase